MSPWEERPPRGASSTATGLKGTKSALRFFLDLNRQCRPTAPTARGRRERSEPAAYTAFLRKTLAARPGSS